MAKKIEVPFFRTGYNYDMNSASDESALVCPEPSLAQQHMKDECDINVIVERFGLTGRMPSVQLPPMFGDFSDVGTFQEALGRIEDGRRAFDSLPAEVRSVFDNNPAGFVEFAGNPANREFLARNGLLERSDEGNHVLRVKDVAAAFKEALAGVPVGGTPKAAAPEVA